MFHRLFTKIVTGREPAARAGDSVVPVRAASAGGSAGHRPAPAPSTGAGHRPLPTTVFDAHQAIATAMLATGWAPRDVAHVLRLIDTTPPAEVGAATVLACARADMLLERAMPGIGGRR